MVDISTLEDLIETNKGDLAGLNPLPFTAPKGRLRRNAFMSFLDKWNDIVEKTEFYSQNPHNNEGRKQLDDVAKIAAEFVSGGDQNRFGAVYTQMKANNYEQTHKWVMDSLDHAEKSIAKHIDYESENYGEFMDQLDENQLMSIISDPRFPLILVGNKEHDRLVLIKDILMKIGEARQRGEDPASAIQEQLNQYISKKAKEDDGLAIQWNFIMEHRGLSAIIAHSLIEIIGKEFQSYFEGSQGEPDKGKLRSYITRDLRKLHDHRNGIHPRFREDFYKDNMTPKYKVLARAYFKGPKKKLWKLDTNPVKEDFKDEAHGYRMAA